MSAGRVHPRPSGGAMPSPKGDSQGFGDADAKARDGGKGMSKSLDGTPEDALSRGYVPGGSIADQVKSDKPRFA